MKKLLIILFSALIFSSCGTYSTPSVKKDTAKIGDTHGDLSGVADALHKEEAPLSHWEYSINQDKMTDKKTIIASCPSISSLDLKFPYGGLNYGHILIQHRRGSTNVLLNIDRGQILENNIHVRFDENKMETYYPSSPGDGDSKYAFLAPSDRFLGKLKKANRVIIETELFDNGIQQLEFDTRGLVWPPKDSITK